MKMRRSVVKHRCDDGSLQRCGFTWMFPDASFYDLSDIFEGLSVVLQAVVTQGDVVGQR